MCDTLLYDQLFDANYPQIMHTINNPVPGIGLTSHSAAHLLYGSKTLLLSEFQFIFYVE